MKDLKNKIILHNEGKEDIMSISRYLQNSGIFTEGDDDEGYLLLDLYFSLNHCISLYEKIKNIFKNFYEGVQIEWAYKLSMFYVYNAIVIKANELIRDIIDLHIACSTCTVSISGVRSDIIDILLIIIETKHNLDFYDKVTNEFLKKDRRMDFIYKKDKRINIPNLGNLIEQLLSTLSKIRQRRTQVKKIVIYGTVEL
ncbi:hypothetical protein AGLY_000095 [Aphis glycines]|uniref:Uncharacterized protein n=1 Tax=Aphis glycines TaxID=307491 RepID=A0A6G0U654_APHGL|nr:hypothetical protein AGLY_000095 [Aphis glycines]